MKRLLLIGGPMGVGKSSVCQALMDELMPCVYLDGDWCWNMRPFLVTEETKAMVMDNICSMLNRFLSCTELETIIFGWVMHQQAIWDELCRRLPLEEVSIYRFSLLASPDELRRRLTSDIKVGLRSEDVIERSLDYLPLYRVLDTIHIDTDGKDPKKIAQEIAKICCGGMEGK